MRPRDVSLHMLAETNELPEFHAETRYARERQRPATSLQALMEAAPGDTPAESIEDLQPLIDAVQDVILLLPQRDRDMIHETFYRGHSQRSAGRALGLSKSTANRVALALPDKIRPLLASHPIIRERLGMTPTWNFACTSVVRRIYRQWDALTTSDRDPSLDAIDWAIDEWKRWGDQAPAAFRHEAVVETVTLAAVAAMWEATAFDNWEWPTVDEMVALLARKHHDYGTEAITRFGLWGVLIRLSDKLARWRQLSSLQESDTVACEPLTDTLLDIFGYVVIANMLDEGTFCYELAADPQVGIAA